MKFKIEWLHFQNTSKNCQLRPHLVESLIKTLDQHNVLVHSFRYIRDRYVSSELQDFRMRIRSDRDHLSPQYSAPIASEIVGFVVGDLSAE